MNCFIYRFSESMLLLLLVTMVFSCKNGDEPEPVTPSGNISFVVEHMADGLPLKRNEMIYTNAAGNEYMIADLMYFISDITLYRHDGKLKMIGETKDIFYIDENIPETKTIRFSDRIPAGTYDSISFIFGIPEAKNKSNRFVNPPEAIMGWPEVLGGGYHYLMMNGKWKDGSGIIMPFNFHLGIGQLYHGTSYNVDSIYAFVKNCFRVSLPGSSFQMKDKENRIFHLTMNLGEWFENPHVYDHNFWGGAIMQNQPALQMAKENGWDVFSIDTNMRK
ncbi:MAG: MbnP family protein [Bacteroidales bacterium]